MKLEISTSPRATWVWAQNTAEADSLRGILTAARCSFTDATGKNAKPGTLDLDIGIVAAEGLTALEAAGYSLHWHPTQHELNRVPALFGLTIKEF